MERAVLVRLESIRSSLEDDDEEEINVFAFKKRLNVNQKLEIRPKKFRQHEYVNSPIYWLLEELALTCSRRSGRYNPIRWIGANNKWKFDRVFFFFFAISPLMKLIPQPSEVINIES